MPTTTVSINANSENTAGGYKHTAVPVTGGTFTDDYAAGEWQARKIFTGAQYQYSNVFLRFDTSLLPDWAVITAAKLRLYVSDINDNATTYSVQAEYYDYGGSPSVAADWVETCSAVVAELDIGSFVDDRVNDMTITDFSGINLAGYTGVRLALSSGVPTNFNKIVVQFRSTPWVDPKLEVTYTDALVFDDHPKPVLRGATL